MEQYIIEGGTPIRGEVTISGAKNAALGILAASIMCDEDVLIENIPNVNDINVMLEAISHIGAKVDRIDAHTVCINGSTITNLEVADDYMRRIRASYYFIGSLLGKYRNAKVPLPGGCAIGARPIDQHLKGFHALGAEIEIGGGMLHAKADVLKAAHIYFDVVTVGGTINVMMAAVMAKGQTIIENAAREPHIVDVANFLNSMGAKIKGAGTDTIRIRGVESLHGTEYAIIPDQIESGTFMCMAAATRGDILIKNVIPKHLESITAKLLEMGNEVQEYDEAVRVIGAPSQRHTDIKTLPYPGFPTDMQPQITVALALAEGTSVVTESIFENRFKYVEELARMGGRIRVQGNVAVVDGIKGFSGATVSAPDLRAGAALVIAALQASGRTRIEEIGFIKRGYEDFDKKIAAMGGKITYIQ
ncbi:MAG: UDP-N-acetylglucosamine 1-carboxyvinyltransferase [Lachnospiraceae bacterium]|jgi:UDP-N-acetylglucosamine 1-carboxyvinyltransferase|nr:UDP-N-acetylglucosamine 1-carboxyvinyltransferase [Lachnospiraceae bacterium]